MKKKPISKTTKNTTPSTTRRSSSTSKSTTSKANNVDQLLLDFGTVDDEDTSTPDTDTSSPVDPEQDTEILEKLQNPDVPFTAEDFDRLLDEFIRSEHRRLEQEDAEDEDTDPEDDDQDTDSEDDDQDTDPDDEVTADICEDDAGPQEPLLKSMDFLVGLDSVKKKLTEYEKVVRFNGWRRTLKLRTMPIPLHAMFLGSPGTGKTTVAKMMGMMMKRAGMLSRGHVVVTERAKLIGTLYGDPEKKTMEALEEAEGGILFIDEAYQLYHPEDARDPGSAVIETLMTALADESRNDWMLIMAGYPDRMRQMFDMNPGLSSRIPEANIYTFEDLDEGQLMQVAEGYFRDYEYKLTPEAHDALARRIAADYAARDRYFGNARYVHHLIQAYILPAMAARVVDSDSDCVDNEDLTTILPADIPAPVPVIPRGRRPLGFVA